MAKIEINIPDVAQIIIVGPAQCGKSIVLARIEKMLRKEFGASTVSSGLSNERRTANPDNPEDWESKMVGKTTWVLTERSVGSGMSGGR